jgi:hypothetical protein
MPCGGAVGGEPGWVCVVAWWLEARVGCPARQRQCGGWGAAGQVGYPPMNSLDQCGSVSAG